MSGYSSFGGFSSASHAGFGPHGSRQPQQSDAQHLIFSNNPHANFNFYIGAPAPAPPQQQQAPSQPTGSGFQAHYRMFDSNAITAQPWNMPQNQYHRQGPQMNAIGNQPWNTEHNAQNQAGATGHFHQMPAAGHGGFSGFQQRDGPAQGPSSQFQGSQGFAPCGHQTQERIVFIIQPEGPFGHPNSQQQQQQTAPASGGQQAGGASVFAPQFPPSQPPQTMSQASNGALPHSSACQNPLFTHFNHQTRTPDPDAEDMYGGSSQNSQC